MYQASPTSLSFAFSSSRVSAQLEHRFMDSCFTILFASTRGLAKGDDGDRGLVESNVVFHGVFSRFPVTFPRGAALLLGLFE